MLVSVSNYAWYALPHRQRAEVLADWPLSVPVSIKHDYPRHQRQLVLTLEIEARLVAIAELHNVKSVYHDYLGVAESPESWRISLAIEAIGQTLCEMHPSLKAAGVAAEQALDGKQRQAVRQALGLPEPRRRTRNKNYYEEMLAHEGVLITNDTWDLIPRPRTRAIEEWVLQGITPAWLVGISDWSLYGTAPRLLHLSPECVSLLEEAANYVMSADTSRQHKVSAAIHGLVNSR